MANIANQVSLLTMPLTQRSALTQLESSKTMFNWKRHTSVIRKTQTTNAKYVSLLTLLTPRT